MGWFVLLVFGRNSAEACFGNGRRGWPGLRGLIAVRIRPPMFESYLAEGLKPLVGGRCFSRA